MGKEPQPAGRKYRAVESAARWCDKPAVSGIADAVLAHVAERSSMHLRVGMGNTRLQHGGGFQRPGPGAGRSGPNPILLLDAGLRCYHWVFGKGMDSFLLELFLAILHKFFKACMIFMQSSYLS